MIIEYIRYKINPEQKQAFIAGYTKAQQYLQVSPHCLGYEMAHCQEDASQYILRIEWDSLEGHMQGFRREVTFPPFFAEVKPFFANIEEMQHYTVVPQITSRKSSLANSKSNP